MKNILSMNQVSKNFPNKPMFEKISFSFENGCYCLVGPNGVGKTVLIEMIAGVLLQDSGSIELSNIGNNTSIAFKQRLVFIPGKPQFFPSTTGTEFLKFVMSTKQSIASKTKVESLCSKFSLDAHINTMFSKMSLGTQKKLFLSTLAIGDNSIIILDEPENGLDGNSFDVLCELLEDIKNKAILILATHDPILIEKLSPHIIELTHSPTKTLNVTNTFRHKENEKIL